MKVGAIIFSRMSSKRLPGKAMMDISGKTLLQRVIERTKKIKLIDHFCLATSKNQEDDIISTYAESMGLDVFRGSLDDVAKRAFEASKKYSYDSFLRVCADRPFLDSKLYDNMINIHKKNNFDITTNLFPRTVPPGLSGEIINVNSLETILQLTTDTIDREHVTRYFYQNPKNFKIYNCDIFKDKTTIDLRLVIDDERDLERSRWIVSNLEKKKKIIDETEKIISLAKQWEINNKTIKL
tara:strand:- start:151 stop:867 length:717 start_codon:yes stop_codon:yes gene_type:complete